MNNFVSHIISTQNYIFEQKLKFEKDASKKDILDHIDRTQLEIFKDVEKKVSNFDILPKFAYQLRLKDDSKDTFTELFLKGKIPDFLYKIIISNKPDPSTKNKLVL